MNDLRKLFLLRPDVVYLNHGAVGACPLPVFEKYQEWQRELERDPVRFFNEQSYALMEKTRERLAVFLGADAGDLLLFTNVTTALNTVFRSLPLSPGDEVLTTGHEYGAMNMALRCAGAKCGARLVCRPVPVPFKSAPEIVEDFWTGVTPRTRVILMDHISSATALTFPVAEIARRGREAGIITVIDGAHAPGQIPVDLSAVGADFYGGVCHKWMMAPKGSGFLYVRRERHDMLQPLVVSWGLERETPGISRFAGKFEDQGVRDPSAFLVVPDAIDFRERHDWSSVQAGCHRILCAAQERLLEMRGVSLVTPRDPARQYQMAAFEIPRCDERALHARLLDEFRIQIPVYRWNDRSLARLSVQGYNTAEDVDSLLGALRRLLPA